MEESKNNAHNHKRRLENVTATVVVVVDLGIETFETYSVECEIEIRVIVDEVGLVSSHCHDPWSAYLGLEGLHEAHVLDSTHCTAIAGRHVFLHGAVGHVAHICRRILAIMIALALVHAVHYLVIRWCRIFA